MAYTRKTKPPPKRRSAAIKAGMEMLAEEAVELEPEDDEEEPADDDQTTGVLPGAVVAKKLGIYLGQIYSYIKSGKVVNHKVGGYPEGKGVEVDIDEVKRARDSGHRRGGKGSGKPKRERDPDTGVVIPPVKTKRLKTGTMVSYSSQNAKSPFDQTKPPHFTLAQVLGSGKHLTYLDPGTGQRVHYTGRIIDNIFYGTDRLSLMLAKGVARIEKPVLVLGMVLLAFVTEGELELAESLEYWMTENGLEVHVPEIVDMADEPDDDEVVAAAEDDEDA